MQSSKTGRGNTSVNLRQKPVVSVEDAASEGDLTAGFQPGRNVEKHGEERTTRRNLTWRNQNRSSSTSKINPNQNENRSICDKGDRSKPARRNLKNEHHIVLEDDYALQPAHVKRFVPSIRNSRRGLVDCKNVGSFASEYRQNGYRSRGENRTKSVDCQKQGHHEEDRQKNIDRKGYRRDRWIGFKHFENLLKLDEEDFVLSIPELMDGLNKFVNRVDLTDDSYVLMIRIMSKIFDSRFPLSQQTLAQTILKEQFINNLQKYLGSLPMHDEEQKRQNRFFWQDPNAFWVMLIKVSRKTLEITPNFASNILPKVVRALQVCIPAFEDVRHQRVPDEVKAMLDELDKGLQATKLRLEDKTAVTIVGKRKKNLAFGGEEPSDDFRTISIYPEVSELMGGRSFVRPNIIDAPYKDVHHYLDVQFRLLREDFINPLRRGVHLIQSGEKKRFENVRVHKKIRFLYPEVINEYHCIRLKFNFSQKKLNFRYENSRKFMYGTLLCFTCDNFTTMKFGRIIKRDVEDLSKGELVVGFDSPESDLKYNQDYLMIECSIYFEPYFHVLTALKTIGEDDFAMKEYIIDVQSLNVLPNYLDHRTIYVVDGKGVTIDDLIVSTDNCYGFNNSQMGAFKAALTQEFSIIQGPPGTGKTFVGLKIAKTLLLNCNDWWESTPMLIVCFTNHALDQFLEGLLDTTTKIVRIGGQSKNNKLKSLNLTEIRKKTDNRDSHFCRNLVQRTLTKLGSVTTAIKEIEQFNGIIAFSEIYTNVHGDDESFEIFDTKDSGFFIDWLLEGYQEHFSKRNEHAKNVGLSRCGRREREQDDNYEPIAINDTNADGTHQSLAVSLLEKINFSKTISAITLKNIDTQIETLKSKLISLENEGQEMMHGDLTWIFNSLQIAEIEGALLELEGKYIYLEERLAGVKNAIRNQGIRTNINGVNPTSMRYDDRWALYTSWLNTHKQDLQRQAASLTQEFQGLYKQYEEVQNLEDTQLLRKKLVVGITTTSAARLRPVIEGLRSPIVIFEEAAEVLEAHIITTLQKHCQHLILIGDHKQLKPSSADFEITKDYNLGVSLFERMVNNGIECHTLNIQHRMRPEFTQLICPMIYPDLRNHESVNNRPPIAGIDSYIRFITHTHLEHDCGDNPTKKNFHEVKFAVALARHLILNGYKPEQVTILAAYLGQKFEMSKEQEQYGSIMKEVRIAALDNYQGEESDIIILSLVRSNKENRIGFLNIENRVCVALSRAKHGLYITGNMDMLCSKSELWRKIRRVLECQNAIGPDLLLRCGIHTDTVTRVTKGEDFMNVSEGGCNQMCRAELVCGHFCRSLCHIQNRDHKDYQCLERCNKKLCDNDTNHTCRKMCFEECGPCKYKVMRKLDCGHEILLDCYVDPDTYNCLVLIETKLPCDHSVDKPCHVDTDTFICPRPCESIVESCGHACTRKCHVRNDPAHLEYKCMKKCARPRVDCTMLTESTKHPCVNFCYEPCAPCVINIKKQGSNCSHIHEVACNKNVDTIKCEKPCKRLLSCGHKCKKKCNEPCELSLCMVKVEKILKVCEHKMKTFCYQEPNRNRCDKKCPLTLPCGHACNEKCNKVCTPKCAVLIDCQIEAACGHVITKIKCHDFSNDIKKMDRKLVENCTQPCNAQLKCGHKCSGTCGECLQGRYHKRCMEKCGVPLICNHECDYPCREACRACNKPCTYRCAHSVCRRKCGEICVPCKEQCRRMCRHQKCSRFCSSICDVPPCTEPCAKLLKCGHGCIGFCGEPCPPKCLICDREELLETDILFGTEEENSRFVFLSDCKHIIENDGMDQWLKMGGDSSAIGVKVCPKCKTPIKTTQRYSDYIKRAINDVNLVKIKAIGSGNENNAIRQDLLQKITTLKVQFAATIWNSYLQKLEKRLSPIRKQTRQSIDKIQLTAMTSKLQVLEHLLEICKNQEEWTFCLQYQHEIHNVLTRDTDFITTQEIADIMSEMRRFHRAMQYERMKHFPNFSSSASIAEVKYLVENIEVTLNRLGTYINDDKLKSWLHELNKVLGERMRLTELERREIVEAMGFAPGHWFKCPNGHIYAIGECGGAMERSKCNECGAAIGGTSHALLQSNSLAREMDGARHPAWSDTANNLGNFMDLWN